MCGRGINTAHQPVDRQNSPIHAHYDISGNLTNTKVDVYSALPLTYGSLERLISPFHQEFLSPWGDGQIALT